MASKTIPQRDIPTEAQGVLLTRLKNGPVACGTFNKPTESAVVRKGWVTASGGWLKMTHRGRDALLLVD